MRRWTIPRRFSIVIVFVLLLLDKSACAIIADHNLLVRKEDIPRDAVFIDGEEVINERLDSRVVSTTAWPMDGAVAIEAQVLIPPVGVTATDSSAPPNAKADPLPVAFPVTPREPLAEPDNNPNVSATTTMSPPTALQTSSPGSLQPPPAAENPAVASPQPTVVVPQPPQTVGRIAHSHMDNTWRFVGIVGMCCSLFGLALCAQTMQPKRKKARRSKARHEPASGGQQVEVAHRQLHRKSHLAGNSGRGEPLPSSGSPVGRLSPRSMLILQAVGNNSDDWTEDGGVFSSPRTNWASSSRMGQIGRLQPQDEVGSAFTDVSNTEPPSDAGGVFSVQGDTRSSTFAAAA